MPLRKPSAVVAAALFAILPAGQIAAADPLMDSGCAASALTVNAAHEFGHDLGAVAVGVPPLHPLTQFGDKWSEGQSPRYRRIVLGGHVGQLWWAAMAVAIPGLGDDCAPAMSLVGAAGYLLRSEISPLHAGDYDPFMADRRPLALGAIVGSALLMVLGDESAPLFGE